MGVVNLTPDSFSDGGRFHSRAGIDIPSVVDAASAMITEGADWLDLGGESTRPGAPDVSEQEEIDRVLPALEALKARFSISISVDTSTPALITEAGDLGADMINDVRALTRPGALEAFVGAKRMKLCMMHMQGTPQDMQDDPSYSGVVSDQIRDFLSDRMDTAIRAGIEKTDICIDPGFGFGKSLAHNLQILRDLRSLKQLGVPILVGVSRKSFIGTITERAVDERLAGTIALNTIALQNGASILRVHDVAEAVDAVKIWNALENEGFSGS